MLRSSFRDKEWARFGNKVRKGYRAPASYMVPTPGVPMANGMPLPPAGFGSYGVSYRPPSPPRRQRSAAAALERMAAAAIMTNMKAVSKKKKKSKKSRSPSPPPSVYITRSGRRSVPSSRRSNLY